jgi:uncharacterized protein YnzC (UPF0291/DUF896 family)
MDMDMFSYIQKFQIDIENLIDAIKNVDIYTQDGEDIKNELLNKLYNES